MGRSSWLLRCAVAGLAGRFFLDVAFTGSLLAQRPSHAEFEGIERPKTRLARVQEVRATGIARHALEVFQAAESSAHVLGTSGLDTSLLTSFADQAGNINGALFQGSLPAYLLFLYFLSYRGNNTPPLVQFGFGFLLTFVLMTIPTGIISKSSYGLILADSDWLHGTAESLLTCTNIMIVLGFRGALLGDKDLADNGLVRNVAFTWLAAVILTLATGIPLFGFEAHAPFLGGLGAIEGMAPQEPVNALSIPNWIVHWSTVFEFLLAMSLAWRFAAASGNERWKGLTWGMFPSSISSVCALTFHVFYNQIPWILTAQAFFTFLGNTTLAIASYRIAVSNGWSVAELDPRPALSNAFASVTGSKEAESSGGKESTTFDIRKVSTGQAQELISGPLLIAEVVLLTLLFAYGTKYGELMFGSSVFQSPDSSLAAVLVILLPVSLVAYTIYSSSEDLRSGRFPPLALTADEVTAKVSPEA
eukprot:TRINITY_DN25060_c0_g1_i1.p1 TRINITY_DN25060_c0_g1~~TRINITY_DN25060_c0_g1_i1.p1  ORF type:complete len:475 (-),score=87.59 TRINITY_DN25060_c0_g1_i1:42-1466(-)